MDKLSFFKPYDDMIDLGYKTLEASEIFDQNVVKIYTNYSENFVEELGERYIPYEEYYPAYKDVIQVKNVLGLDVDFNNNPTCWVDHYSDCIEALFDLDSYNYGDDEHDTYSICYDGIRLYLDPDFDLATYGVA